MPESAPILYFFCEGRHLGAIIQPARPGSASSANVIAAQNDPEDTAAAGQQTDGSTLRAAEEHF